MLWFTDSKENLEKISQKIDKTLKQEYNMKINKPKTQILVCSKQQVNTNIIMDNIELETLKSFTYLRSKITYNRKSTMDINCRITQVKQVFNKKKKLFTTITIN